MGCNNDNIPAGATGSTIACPATISHYGILLCGCLAKELQWLGVTERNGIHQNSFKLLFFWPWVKNK